MSNPTGNALFAWANHPVNMPEIPDLQRRLLFLLNKASLDFIQSRSSDCELPGGYTDTEK